MPCGTDEVQASMDTQIRFFAPLRLLFLTHIGLMLVVNELHDRKPRVSVVDVVAETRGVDDGELYLELLLFKLCLDYFNLGKLVELLVVTLGVVLGG